MVKFFGKNPHKKYVRQFPNSIVKHVIQSKVDKKETNEENKEIKKDKGLIERTENSTILLTEDNKIVLND